MPELFVFEYDMFESQIEDACFGLIDTNTEFVESVLENGYITEKAQETFGVKVKKFLDNIVAALRDFYNHFKQQINATVRKKEYSRRLHKLREELKEKRENGVAMIETTDVITLANTYVDMVNDLTTYSKKFSKMKYTTTTEIEKDLEKFNDTVDAYEEKLEKLMDKKIKISTQKMLDFVDKEISGQSKVMKTIADCMDTIEQISDQAKALEVKTDILGADVLTGYTTGIRGIAKRFSLFVKTWSVKIVTTIVYIFA